MITYAVIGYLSVVAVANAAVVTVVAANATTDVVAANATTDVHVTDVVTITEALATVNRTAVSSIHLPYFIVLGVLMLPANYQHSC